MYHTSRWTALVQEGQQSNHLYSSTILIFLLSIIVKSTSDSDMESLSPAFPEPNSEIYDWMADSRIEADIAGQRLTGLHIITEKKELVCKKKR